MNLCSLGQQPSPPTNLVNTVQQQSNTTTAQSPPIQPQSTSVQPTSSVQHQPPPQLQPVVPPTGVNSVTLSPKHNVCLPKTAVAIVRSQNRSTEANIVLDEGSQRSFVTEELANILDLQPYGKELIMISPFGTRLPTSRQLNISKVTLLTRSREESQLSVLVVPFIATPLQNYTSLDFSELPHLQGLQLAHPVSSDTDFAVSLLVGADYYWDIVRDKVVHCSGPTAVESKLGYLLSGPIQQGHLYSMAANVSMITTPTHSDFDSERF